MTDRFEEEAGRLVEGLDINGLEDMPHYRDFVVDTVACALRKADAEARREEREACLGIADYLTGKGLSVYIWAQIRGRGRET
jgi:hypothetical protein